MAKTKPTQRISRSERNRRHPRTAIRSESAQDIKQAAQTLLTEATALLHTSQPEQALSNAQKALSLLQPTAEPTVASLPALNCLGEVYIELGDVDAARDAFARAEALDPEGLIPEDEGGGVGKFFWLAQLAEEGGAGSVRWYEKGADVLRRQIAELSGGPGDRQNGHGYESLLEEKKKALANALCGMAEVYMTDLSWEEDAETRCDALVTEALLVAPRSVEALQTLASVRISQLKPEEARAALSRSLELWRDLAPDDAEVPDFATRISLARLLLEAEMEEDAIEVLERLVEEDDGSVEAWYLGGWCLYIMAGKQAAGSGGHEQGEPSEVSEAGKQGQAHQALRTSSRDWLQNCLKLYQLVEYEDDRLREHATELLAELDSVLGPATGNDPDADAEEADWEDEVSGDDTMST